HSRTAVLPASFYEPAGQLQSPQAAVCLGMGEDAGDRLPKRQAYADEGARGHSGLLRQVAEVSSDQDGRAQAQGRDGRTPAEMRCRR
ncbi:hypothetical protein, partial [Bacteroides ovatus]|uniref:hypothetical protein n=1 Tax=Bacteroides ovatus TaxID=28116 RepID=UPI0022E75C53